MAELKRNLQIFPRIMKAFLRSKVSIQTAGGINETGSNIVSTNADPLQFQFADAHDGRPRLLARADPPLYDMRYSGEFNSVVNGNEILKIAIANPDCAGIYLNSALNESGMIISRETAMLALKS